MRKRKPGSICCSKPIRSGDSDLTEKRLMSASRYQSFYCHRKQNLRSNDFSRYIAIKNLPCSVGRVCGPAGEMLLRASAAQGRIEQQAWMHVLTRLAKLVEAKQG